MSVPALRQGDIVDIIAPASPFRPAELRDAVRAARALGLEPRLPASLLKPDGMFASSDQRRLAQIARAVSASDARLIWALRGGYGSVRLLEAMAKWPRPKQTKILLGYSDLTSLHTFFNQRWGWPSLHGPMFARLGRAVPAAERRQQLDILFGRRSEVEFASLVPLNARARKRGRVKGTVLGGNLAVLQGSLGTPFALRPKGAILFFEDIGERPHRVDRMLTQMIQAGWFRQAKAVAFGDFNLSDPKDRRQLWREVIPRFVAAVDIPVVAGLPCGHCAGKQLTLPFNTPATLELGTRPSLTVSIGLSAPA